MTRVLSSPALLLVWLLCLPAAILIGYLLATPTDFISLTVIALAFTLLMSPLILKWHHPLLIVAWNSYLIVFFLPGQPSLGIVMAVLSLSILIVNRAMRKESEGLSVPSVARPLIFLLIIILVTAFLTGGLGARVLGSSTFGGKRYLVVLGAIFGYFAMTSRAIAPERKVLLASLFFLSGLTAALSDLIYAAGPAFYPLFYLVTTDIAVTQAFSQDTLLRFSGLTFGSMAVCFFLLMRFGLGGLADWTRPWRILVFTMLVVLSLLGGYRSALVILGIVMVLQFFLEGLHRTSAWIGVAIPVVLLFITLILFIDRMPLAVQRSLSFLPINVESSAKQDAMATLDWRFEIWRIIVPQVPQYLLLGKGFGFSGTDLWLTQEGMRRGFYRSWEDTLITGNYHSGPLTLIIPFGILGVIAFGWFSWAAYKVLLANYRYGNPELRLVNTFLLSFFLGRFFFFIFLYGQFDLDLMLFTGTVGLSIALNNGVAQPQTYESEETINAPRPETRTLDPQFAARGRMA